MAVADFLSRNGGGGGLQAGGFPGLWTTLNLKGCKARYQRVIPVGILHAVEPLEGRVVRTEGELPAQEVIAEGEDGPPDCQAFLLHGAVPSLSL